MKSIYACGLSISLLLAGCGGGGDGGATFPVQPVQQIVSFGDSLSDVGTYAVAGSPPIGPLLFGGGRYTTNPGHVWTEHVAQFYGDRLSPAVQGGFGVLPYAAGGYSYAQGGATVSTVIAKGYTDILAKPINLQIGDYLSDHGAFNPRQLVLMQGGANDILGAVLSEYYGYIDSGAVPVLVSKAATDLANAFGRVVAAGAQQVVLVNVAGIGSAPVAGTDPALPARLTEMSRLFNAVLQAQLARQPQPRTLVLIDSFAWTAGVLANPGAYGFKVAAEGMACSQQKIIAEALAVGISDPMNFISRNGLALLCSGNTLTEPYADQTYMFADQLHPSSGLHTEFAKYVESELVRNGL